MIRLLKRIFGIENKKENDIKHLEKENSFGFSKIYNKSGLLKEIIQNVPDGSIWQIEGIQSKEIYDTIKPFIVEDGIYIKKATVFPKQDDFKIQLNQQSKGIITSKIDSWNLDWEPIHQHIYKDKKSYLDSYDNLHEACTWISNELRNKIQNIEKLIEIEN